MGRKPFAGLGVIARSFVDGFFALMTPVVILGGMFSGLFTPTEAAAVACLYALFLGFVVYRTLQWRQIGPILVETAETSGLVLVLVMAASALGWCMSISRLPQALTPLITGTIGSPIGFLLMANALMLIVGCFMEALAAMLILIPILVPVAIQYGIDPVQFGVVMVLNLILGTIHPPIGVGAVRGDADRRDQLRAHVARHPAPGWCRCWWCCWRSAVAAADAVGSRAC